MYHLKKENGLIGENEKEHIQTYHKQEAIDEKKVGTMSRTRSVSVGPGEVCA
jgi:hypothetical protein